MYNVSSLHVYGIWFSLFSSSLYFREFFFSIFIHTVVGPEYFIFFNVFSYFLFVLLFFFSIEKIPPVQQPLYYAASAQTYQPHHVAPQHFMMPPPPYSSTAPQYSIIPVPITTAHQPPDTSGMRLPTVFHNVAAAPPAGYTMAPQVRSPNQNIFIRPFLHTFFNLFPLFDFVFFFHMRK